MRRLLSSLLLVILSACATLPADRQPAKDQIATATRAWQAAYDSRDPNTIVSMYDARAVLWGTTAKAIAPSPAAVWEYFKDAARRRRRIRCYVFSALGSKMERICNPATRNAAPITSET
jgi:hypothetical protein